MTSVNRLCKKTTLKRLRGLPGDPVVQTLCPQCRGHRFNPWLGNKDPTYSLVGPKKKKKPKGQLTGSENIGLFVFLYSLCFPIYFSSFLYRMLFFIIRRIQTISANKIQPRVWSGPIYSRTSTQRMFIPGSCFFSVPPLSPITS